MKANIGTECYYPIFNHGRPEVIAQDQPLRSRFFRSGFGDRHICQRSLSHTHTVSDEENISITIP